MLNALVANGHQVIAAGRRPVGERAHVEWRELDLEWLAEASNHFPWPLGVDLVINAAGLLSTDSRLMENTQDKGARALFDLAAQHAVPVLQISALGAGEHPDIDFLASKGRADAYLLGLPMPSVVLRPSLVLGRGGASSAWLAGLSAWPLVLLPDLLARLQPLQVEELCVAVLALLRRWPAAPTVLPLVGAEVMTLAQLIDRLRAAQGWAPAHYLQAPAVFADAVGRLGERFGWQALNPQSLAMARRDNLADAEPLARTCGYQPAPLRLESWPERSVTVQRALRPLFIAALLFIWLGTAFVCLGPGNAWGLRIMAQAGVQGWPAAVAVNAGALLDGALGVGLLVSRWRRVALLAQLGLMVGYTLFISLVLPQYWLDPYAAVAKNLVLMVATLWLLWTEPRR